MSKTDSEFKDPVITGIIPALAASGAGLATAFGGGITYKVRQHDGSEVPLTPKNKRHVRNWFKNRGTNIKIEPIPKEIEKLTPAAYSPTTNKVYMSRSAGASTLAHELGHADNARQFQKYLGPKLGKAVQISSLPVNNFIPVKGSSPLGPLGPMGFVTPMGLVALPLLSDKVSDKLRPISTKMVDIIQERPEIVGAAAVSPLLIEEGRASAKAIRSMPKGQKWRAFKDLAGAYGTYVGIASLPVAALYGYGRYKKQRKLNKENEMNKLDFLTKKHLEKKAYVAIAPIKTDAPYHSFGNWASEYINSGLGAAAGSGIGFLAPLPLLIPEKTRIPGLALSILGGITGGIVGGYRSMKKSQEVNSPEIENPVTPANYAGRLLAQGVGGTVIPLPFVGSGVGDYVASRHVINRPENSTEASFKL